MLHIRAFANEKEVCPNKDCITNLAPLVTTFAAEQTRDGTFICSECSCVTDDTALIKENDAK